MNPPAQVRKRLWLLAYSAHSFRKSQEACRLLLASVHDTKHDAYFPLVTAIHALYCRPFDHNRGIGRLSEATVPTKHVGAHRFLTTFRDMVFIHSDSTPLPESGRVLNLLSVRIDERVSLMPATPLPRLDSCERAIPCIDFMHKTVIKEIDEIVRKYAKCFDREVGDYLFHLEGDVFLSPYEPPVTGKVVYRPDSDE